ncbi:hypothetical protein MRB53_041701 [Persea americana]|nr:hypothetical protein MRB53_041701 [Persea americana]
MIDFSRRIFYNEALQQGGYAPALVAEWERAIESAIENDIKARTIIKSFIRDSSAPLKEHLITFSRISLPHAESILPVISSNNHDTRSSAAHAFAILASHPSSTSINRYLQELLTKTKTWQTAVGSQVSQVHGTIVTLGYYFARKQYRGLLLHEETLCKDFIIELTQELIPNAKDAMIKESAFTAIGQLAMFGVLKLDSTVLESMRETSFTKMPKQEMRQRSLLWHSHVWPVAGSLVLWPLSSISTVRFLKVMIRAGVVERLVQRFIKDCANTKPALKKAAVMGGVVFGSVLCASRGLGLVYEKGDRSLRDDLVRDLVSSFSSDKQSSLAGTVSADTQLFEPGALPTGDGSVSTYKDIMSLASEVGDSSLVYKFMSMASSNAIWSSRAAFGRFGLSNVLSDSSVDGYLADNPKLYPKLYRYRFDPNTGVRRSMNDIWNALIKDSCSYHKYSLSTQSFQDLLVSILGKEWRTRQASCAAIADLLQGRPLEKYESYLEDVWNKCFKVLDDIKESVRAAAASLARTLTGILTRALEADNTSSKTAGAMLKHVLPFYYLHLEWSQALKKCRCLQFTLCLRSSRRVVEVTLRLFIPELVERLIGLLSSLEPEAVNYIHLNASKYNLTEQKIDDYAAVQCAK